MRVVPPLPGRLVPFPVPFRKAAIGGKADIKRLAALAEKLEPQIRGAFLEAVERLGAKIDVKALADLLAQGQIETAFALVQRAIVDGGAFSQFAAIAAQAALTTGQAAVRSVFDRGPADLDFVFSATNPATVDFLRSYEMGLVRELSANALGSVRAALQAGVGAGRNPLDTARDVRAAIGLTERQSQAVENFRALLTDRDPVALDRALRDKRFDASVARAIRDEADLTPAQIDRMVERYREKYLKYRSETIARTESIRAVSVGNHEAWKQSVASGAIEPERVRRFWIFSHDSRTRDAHVAIPSMNPDGVGLEEPFASPLGPIMYPGDPAADPGNTINCRCTVFLRYDPPADQGGG